MTSLSFQVNELLNRVRQHSFDYLSENLDQVESSDELRFVADLIAS